MAEFSATEYWRYPFFPLCDHRQLTEFYVLQIEPLDPTAVNGSCTNLSQKVRLTTLAYHVMPCDFCCVSSLCLPTPGWSHSLSWVRGTSNSTVGLTWDTYCVLETRQWGKVLQTYPHTFLPTHHHMVTRVRGDCLACPALRNAGRCLLLPTTTGVGWQLVVAMVTLQCSVPPHLLVAHDYLPLPT